MQPRTYTSSSHQLLVALFPLLCRDDRTVWRYKRRDVPPSILCGTAVNMEHETLLPTYTEQSKQAHVDPDYDRDALEDSGRIYKDRKIRTKSPLVLSFCLCLISLLTGFFASSLLEKTNRDSAKHVCSAPSIRREWRSLSDSEKDVYVDAVRCLRTKPSRIGMNHTLYDDFAYVHFQSNKESKHTYTEEEILGCSCFLIVHFAAAFLSWHRYLIHTYHQLLVNECHYAGELP